MLFLGARTPNNKSYLNINILKVKTKGENEVYPFCSSPAPLNLLFHVLYFLLLPCCSLILHLVSLDVLSPRALLAIHLIEILVHRRVS